MNLTRFRSAGVALGAVALAASLTACQNDDGAAAQPGTRATASAPAQDPATAAPADPSSGASAKPAAKPAATPSKETAQPAAKPAAKPTAKPATKPGGTPGADCVTTAPTPDEYDPDEFALYRIEELPGSTGKVNLILQHGAWGCGGKDTDGGPFVVSGEESRWALDQAAYVTATDPIVASTENIPIGVQELIDWVNAHPDSGLVFKYQTGDDGAIHRLEQVFTP
ncbi:hypothetical protein [Streptomyces sp. NPDC127114]|uniref:hypothetical protein n=1 Tax=Streptomyces sp. NPDC127114 TaxID=3345366 RepID=UPI00363FF91A